MLQLLYPIGLLAALGIIIPVVIHLWNIKSGKTLKIGSISLLGTASNQRSTHLKIADWPLLLLRCLLIALLALLLGSPVYQSAHPAAEEEGWIVVEKQHLSAVWKANRKVMDSLVRKGFEIHDFNTGFEKLELKDTATIFSGSAAVPLSYFSLLKQLDAQKRPGAKVYLYTENSAARFEGNRPYIHLQLNWKVFPADTAAVAAVKKANAGKLLVLINAAGQQIDAAYVRSAIQAIADFTRREIEIREISNIGQVKSPANLVFWLAESPLSKLQLQQLPAGLTFFNYAGRKTERIRSAVQLNLVNSAEEIDLYQRKTVTGDHGRAIWTDAYGSALLSLDTSGKINHYQFYSRFNQNWTNLVWSNRLAEALLPLVIAPKNAELAFPSNAAQSLQSIPMPISIKIKSAAVYYTTQSLSALLWWLLLIVFFLERLISYRKSVYKI
jgi:hypothetical protein